MTRQLAHAGRIDAALGEVVRTHRLDPRAASERQIGQLVRGIVGARRDDAVARTEVERGHRLAEADRCVLDDGHVPGSGAHHPAQQLVRLAHTRLGFVLRLVGADRGFALEVRRERQEHRLGHERRARVVQMDPVPAPRRLAAPAVELGRRGQNGRRGSSRHVGKARGMTSRAQVGPGFTYPRRCLTTNHTFAGRSASRRMYHGNQCVP